MDATSHCRWRRLPARLAGSESTELASLTFLKSAAFSYASSDTLDHAKAASNGAAYEVVAIDVRMQLPGYASP